MRLALFLAAMTLLHVYLGRRIVALSVPLNLRARRVFGWGLVGLTFVLLLSTQFVYRNWRLPPDAFGFQYFSILAYFLIGYLVTLLCVLLPVDVLRLSLFVLGSLLESLTRLTRSSFSLPRLTLGGRLPRVRATGGLGLLVSALVAAIIGLFVVIGGPAVKQVVVANSGLHPDLRGFRIVQFTDLHVGPTVLRADVKKTVDLVNAQNPDLIVFTGDLVDGFVDQLAAHTEPLAELRARYGVFAVTGNHEYYWGAPEWIRAMESLGMRVLTDEHVVIPVGEARLLVGGVPDQQARQFVPGHHSDPVKSLIGAPEVDFKVLLAHRPGSCFGALEAGYDLMLAGHTHGGQFIPWNFFVPFAHPYTRGLNRHEGMWVYVSAGTQYWGPPNRFGVPGEVAVITLQ